MRTKERLALWSVTFIVFFPLIHKLHAYLLTVKEKHDKQRITNHSQPKERHKGNSIGGL